MKTLLEGGPKAMIQWRAEDRDNWFGRGVFYRYALQRTGEQDRWELWRMQELDPQARWQRLDDARLGGIPGLLTAKIAAEDLEGT